MPQRQEHPNRTRQYHKRQAKARQRRRRTAAERLARDRRQAQQAAKALEQALHDFGSERTKVRKVSQRLLRFRRALNLQDRDFHRLQNRPLS